MQFSNDSSDRSRCTAPNLFRIHKMGHSTMARYKVFAILMYFCLLGSHMNAELLPPPLLDQPNQPFAEATKLPLEDVLNGTGNATTSLVCALTDTNCGESIVLISCISCGPLRCLYRGNVPHRAMFLVSGQQGVQGGISANTAPVPTASPTSPADEPALATFTTSPGGLGGPQGVLGRSVLPAATTATLCC